MQTRYTSVCGKNWKKVRLTRTHVQRSAEKITDTKKLHRKLEYELLTHTTALLPHERTAQGSCYGVRECTVCTRGLNLALLCVRDLQESKTSASTISHEVFFSGQFNIGANRIVEKVLICIETSGVAPF